MKRGTEAPRVRARWARLGVVAAALAVGAWGCDAKYCPLIDCGRMAHVEFTAPLGEGEWAVTVQVDGRPEERCSLRVADVRPEHLSDNGSLFSPPTAVEIDCRQVALGYLDADGRLAAMRLAGPEVIGGGSLGGAGPGGGSSSGGSTLGGSDAGGEGAAGGAVAIGALGLPRHVRLTLSREGASATVDADITWTEHEVNWDGCGTCATGMVTLDTEPVD